MTESSVLNFGLSSLDHWIASVRSLPLGVHFPAVVAVVAGLILWSSGGKVLKPMIVLLGASLGALLGGLLLPAFLPPKLDTVPSPYVGLAVGALGGAAMGFALFRFAMMWTGALAFAIAGVLGAGAYLSHTPDAIDLQALKATHDEKNPEFRAQLDSLRQELTDAGRTVITNRKDRQDRGEPLDLRSEFSEAASALAATRTREFVNTSSDDVRAMWSNLPDRGRLIVAGAGFASGVLGLLLGLFAPKKAAGAVTAMLGAAAWLAGGVWLLRAFNVRPAWLDQSPTNWLIIGAVASALGVMIQWRRKKNVPASPAPAAPAPA